MKINLFVCILFTTCLILSSCEKEQNDYYQLSGEFAKTSGTCTPYCLIHISGTTLTLEGIDYSGSTSVVYIEKYERRKQELNVYDLTTEPGSYIMVHDMTSFTFTSNVRTCEFSQ